MNSIKRTVINIILLIALKCNPITTRNIVEHEKFSNYNLFAADLFPFIVEEKLTENVIFSPASVQTCMALTFVAAEGETAEEIRKVLRLGDGDKIQIAEKFGKLSKANLATYNQAEEAPILKMANRVYVNNQLKISEQFNEIAQEYFDTQAEQVNFTDTKMVVENVNQWVAQQTENKIKDIVKEDAFSSDTNAILLNAIYFKAKWLNPFSQSSTSTENFHVNLSIVKAAETMYNEAFYKYAELPELAATALEMPYNNSDISMLIILPNEIEGLQNLEQKLKNKDLNDITRKMGLRKVYAYIPKFRIEFDVDLKETLKKMGLVNTFSSSANFKSLFTTPELQGISEVNHKAFLDINEAGSEAAATTFATLTTLSANFDQPIFRANHPFVFAIRSASVVYFAGHVVTV